MYSVFTTRQLILTVLKEEITVSVWNASKKDFLGCSACVI